MFNFKNVSYFYADNSGLDHINLRINSGEAVAIMGPNGSGKSTLFKIIMGLIQPENGDFYYKGVKPDFNQLHQKVGFVFQNSGLQLFTESVWEELAFGPQQLELDEKEIEERVNDILRLLEIEHLANRIPYQLSGGEQKLVALGSVLTMNPESIILDEPFAGLSRKYQEKLILILKTLTESGKTLIISSHNFKQVKPLVDRVVTLEENHRIRIDQALNQLSESQKKYLDLL